MKLIYQFVVKFRQGDLPITVKPVYRSGIRAEKQLKHYMQMQKRNEVVSGCLCTRQVDAEGYTSLIHVQEF